MTSNQPSSISITPVILCGGAGSRLWPMSRAERPKQFHALFDDRTLLEHTLLRVQPRAGQQIGFGEPCIIGNAVFGDLLTEAARAAPGASIVLEPSIRDTAPAIGACTCLHEAVAPDGLLLVLPSDAHIPDTGAFRAAVRKAARIVLETDAIMTIGVAPDRPETQYGYIETGDPIGDGFAVKRFREKPDAATAHDFVESGRFLWNAGMFLFRTGRMADAFRTLQPAIWQAVSAAVSKARISGNSIWLDRQWFGTAEKVSIDYAIMEKVGNVGVVPAPFAWDDLGAWSQLYVHAAKDEDGNARRGDVIAVEAKRNFVRSDGPVVAVAGVNDLVVVAEANCVLVTKRQTAHLVKTVSQTVNARAAEKLKGPATAAAARRWLLDICLPYWAEHGVDTVHGGVHEALGLDGMPAAHPNKRLRVLARQIYAFAHGEHLGWTGMPDGLLERLFETLTATGWHPTEGGFIHLYHPDGTIADDRRDFYDQCFVLLAFAWLYRMRGMDEARDWADRTLAWMDASLASPHGGYLEEVIGTPPRRANPHMHFLEAMLAWHAATGEAAFLDRAGAIVDLFRTRFFDPATGTLTEFFADDWSRITDRSVPTAIEPGHHYEWAWLLTRYLDLRPDSAVQAQVRTLFATARAFGHHGLTGAAADHVQPDGTAASDRARLWPQTEALKAAIAFERRGLNGAATALRQALDVLSEHYLGRPQPGGWVDAIDAAGTPVAADMPSSTLYHIVAAMAELIQAD